MTFLKDGYDKFAHIRRRTPREALKTRKRLFRLAVEESAWLAFE